MFYLYGINIGANKEEKKVICEIVGKGFDASDMTRGFIDPHQIVTVKENSDDGSIMIYNNEVMSDDDFRNSKITRTEFLLKSGYNVNEQTFTESYEPMNLDEIHRLSTYAIEIMNAYDYSDIVISCVLTIDSRFIFWDIQHPKEKARILHEPEWRVPNVCCN